MTLKVIHTVCKGLPSCPSNRTLFLCESDTEIESILQSWPYIYCTSVLKVNEAQRSKVKFTDNT